MAKLVVPWTIQSHAGGRAPPSRRVRSAATPIMMRPATRKRAPADVNGGRSRRPPLMTTQVLPQMRQRTAMSARMTGGDGGMVCTATRGRRVYHRERTKKIRVGRPGEVKEIAKWPLGAGALNGVGYALSSRSGRGPNRRAFIAVELVPGGTIPRPQTRINRWSAGRRGGPRGSGSRESGHRGGR